MEKIAYEIEELLQEKLSCFRQLCTVLETEKKDIAQMNLDGLWEAAKSKKDLAGRIREIKERIISLLESVSLNPDMDSASFSLAFMVNSLPLSDRAKAGIRRVKHQIETANDQVRQMAKFNKSQVHKYLAVVDEVMAVIGDNSAQAQYNGAGVMPGMKKSNCLFRAEV